MTALQIGLSTSSKGLFSLQHMDNYVDIKLPIASIKDLTSALSGIGGYVSLFHYLMASKPGEYRPHWKFSTPGLRRTHNFNSPSNSLGKPS